MRVILFFDLPMNSSTELKDYRTFRKFLITSGFIMIQKSVYSKLALNQSSVESILENIRKNKPKNGIVQTFSLTEKQYQKMEYIVGEPTTNILESDERLIIL